MKKIFVLISIITFGLSATSQNLSVPHYGIKAGLNYSKVNFTQYNQLLFESGDPTEGLAEPITNYHAALKAGVFVDIKLTAKWYVSPYLSYSQFGGTTKFNRTFDVGTTRTKGEQTNIYTIDYITLDPNFEYRVTNKFSLCVGPSVSYLMSNNIDIKVTNTPTGQNEDYNGEIDDINDLDAGINLGTSFFLTENIDIDLSLYVGMMELENIDDGYSRSRQIANVSCGYTF